MHTVPPCNPHFTIKIISWSEKQQTCNQLILMKSTTYFNLKDMFRQFHLQLSVGYYALLSPLKLKVTMFVHCT